MANQTVLEELVVRLVGDNSSLVKMASDSATVIRTMTNRMYTAMSRIERFAGTLIRGLGSIGLASSLRGMFDQFANLEQGQIRLNAAITGGGHDAEVLVARYTQVAESLSRVTLNTKGSILGLFQQAEAAQLSGNKAEDAVRYAVALAGATNQSADSMMRTAIQLAKGHPEFAKRILNLREIANGSELVDAIMRKMNTGLAIATAEFNSANGRMERLGRSLKTLGNDIGGMMSKVLLPLVGIVQHLADEFKKLEPEQKRQIATILGLTVAWLGMGPITQVLKDLLTPTIHLLKFLVITVPILALNTAAWLLYKGALITAKIATVIYGTVLGIITGAGVSWATTVGVMAAAQTAWAAITTVCTAVATAFSVSLGWMVLPAIVATIGIMAAGFFTVYAALSSVVAAFKNIPSFAAPLGAITKILGEWWDMLKEIFVTAQSDLPRAWRMMQAGFSLAVSQMRDLWAPLWSFIQEGFGVIWDAVARTFKSKMLEATRSALTGVRLVNPAAALALQFLPEVENQNFILNQMRRNLAGLGVGFSVVESEATVAARAAFDALRPMAGAADDAANNLRRVEEGMRKTRQEAQRFDATLHGSVEALSRIAEYRDRISMERTTPPTANAVQSGFAQVAAMSMSGGLGGGPVVSLLSGILQAVQQATVLNVRPAQLGGL